MKSMKTNDLDILTRRLSAFRDARDWQQFHTLKDLIISLNLEAGELLELTQWKSSTSFEASLRDPAYKQHLQEECADVLNYLLMVADKAGIDLIKAAHEKIDANEKKYPVEKSRGNATKYSKL